MSRTSIRQFFDQEEATTTVEYAILITAVALIVAKCCQLLGSGMLTVFDTASTAIESTSN